MTVRHIFRRYGYDPDDPVPRDENGHRIIPDKLLRALAAAPVVDEREITRTGALRRPRSDEHPITEAETEILRLLSCGHGAKEIGLMRGTSLHTVKAQIREAKKSLAARTTVQAVAEAIRRGLL